MKIVVDADVILSVLIKDGISREILFDERLKLVTPSYTISEVNKHKRELSKRVNVSWKEFDKLIGLLFRYMRVIDLTLYKSYMYIAKDLISDEKDVPFLACALAFNTPIWSDDKHFREQGKVKIFTTKDLKRFLEK